MTGEFVFEDSIEPAMAARLATPIWAGLAFDDDARAAPLATPQCSPEQKEARRCQDIRSRKNGLARTWRRWITNLPDDLGRVALVWISLSRPEDVQF